MVAAEQEAFKLHIVQGHDWYISLACNGLTIKIQDHALCAGTCLQVASSLLGTWSCRWPVRTCCQNSEAAWTGVRLEGLQRHPTRSFTADGEHSQHQALPVAARQPALIGQHHSHTVENLVRLKRSW